MKALALVAALALLPQTAYAQDRTVYERWTIYHDVVKPLPSGFHHFVPVSTELATRRFKDEMYVCKDMGTAISFGKRLALGQEPERIVSNISKAWGGQKPCRQLVNKVLRPIAYAVRGDDKGRRIAIVKWLDDSSRTYYTGIPKD